MSYKILKKKNWVDAGCHLKTSIFTYNIGKLHIDIFRLIFSIFFALFLTFIFSFFHTLLYITLGTNHTIFFQVTLHFKIINNSHFQSLLSSPHPYIFFNADGTTMTFMGFFIDDDCSLVDRTTQQIIEAKIIDKGLKDLLEFNLKETGVPLNTDFDTLPR